VFVFCLFFLCLFFVWLCGGVCRGGVNSLWGADAFFFFFFFFSLVEISFFCHHRDKIIIVAIFVPLRRDRRC